MGAAPTLFGFLMVLLRCAALCSTAPLFGTRAVPARVRLSLSVLVATAAFLGAGQPRLAGWEHVQTLLAAALGETLRGLAAGMAARICVDAAAGAGHAISLAMGLGFGAMIDPIHGAESNAISEILSFTTLGLAVALGIHREAIAWVCRSILEAPPGTVVDVAAWASFVVGDVAHAIALSIRVAFPVLVAVTSGHLAFGLLNKVTPQMGIANVGFAVAIIAGGGALFLIAPLAAAIVAEAARSVFVNASIHG